jgi:hypothetical protein
MPALVLIGYSLLFTGILFAALQFLPGKAELMLRQGCVWLPLPSLLTNAPPPPLHASYLSHPTQHSTR